MKRAIAIFAFLFGASAFGQGKGESSTPDGVFKDHAPAGVYTDIVLSGMSGSGSGAAVGPQFYGGSASASVAVGGQFIIGASYEHQQVSQNSAIDSNLGNFSGSREFFAPFVGARLGRFVTKVLWETSGDYRLTKQTATSSYLSYGAPSGWKVNLLYYVVSGIHLSLAHESISFQQLKESGKDAVRLGTPFQLTQSSVGVAYVF